MRLDRRLLRTVAFSALAAFHAPLAAQRAADSAVFRGRVLQQGTLAPIAGADVAIPALDRHATTDSTGAFRLTGLPPGTQIAQVRKVGFAMRQDTIVLAPGFAAVRTYALEPHATKLDTVRTVAPGQRYLSPMLQQFEQRLHSHTGGYFIDDSVFRQNESGTLAGLIASRIPGVTFATGKGAVGRVLVSTRKPCRGLAFRSCSSPDCFVAIYVDGTLYFNAKMAAQGVQPPDLEHDLNPANFAGAEYYAGGASAPIGMHVDDDGCGSLWLWTRER